MKQACTDCPYSSKLGPGLAHIGKPFKCVLSCVAVVISFIDAPYEVNETDGAATVTFELVSSEPLMREVVVELSFSDGTAIGMFKYAARAFNVVRPKSIHTPNPS